MKIIRVLYLSCVMFFAYSASSYSAVLQIENGGLVGATGINVNGTLYSVSFVAGTCIDLFGGCDEISDFFFTDHDTAQAANLALLEQVFIDTPTNDFDSNPALTNGCTNSFTCSVITPINAILPGTSVEASFLRNSSQENLDTHTGIWSNIGIGADFSTDDYPLYTYALWSGIIPSPVPVPAAVWLFGSGLLGLIGVARRKTRV